jgi:hypothetical protein
MVVMRSEIAPENRQMALAPGRASLENVNASHKGASQVIEDPP